LMPEELGPDETQILAAMLGISEMVGGLTDLQEILGTVVRIVPQLVRSNRCAIFSLDSKKGELRCAQAFGPDIEQVKYISGLVIKEADIPKLVQKVLKQHLPALVRDAAKEEILPAQIIQVLGLKAMLIVPLVCRDRVLGIMMLDDTRGSRYFTSKEINIVIGIATMAAIASDSTAVKEELAVEKARLEALSLAMTDALLILDTRFRIKHVSALCQDLLGWNAEELIGKQCSEVFKATDLSGIHVCNRSCLGQRIVWGENVAGETHRLHFERKDGTRILCEVRAAPVRDSRGNVAEIVYALVRAQAAVAASSIKDTEAVDDLDELETLLLGGK